MMISENGLAIIKEFEGYEKAQPDGSCMAYQDYLGNGKYDIPTIGWGCTEGVTMGMTWSHSEAEQHLRDEVNKHVSAINELVTVNISQNQFDALASFSYNCGIGALRNSTILKKLNLGDFEGAARWFGAYNKSQGIVLSGLTRRRAAEAALFLKDSVAPKARDVVDEPDHWSSSQTIQATGAAISNEAVVKPAVGALLPDQIADTAEQIKTPLETLATYKPWIMGVCTAITIGLALWAMYRRFGDYKSGKNV